MSLVLRDLRLVEGTYLLDVAAHRRDGTPYDYLRGLHSFRVKSRLKDVGVYRPAHSWSFAGGLELEAPRPRAELDLHDVRRRPRRSPRSSASAPPGRRPAAGSCSPTGASTCCTPATWPSSRRRGRRATSWWWP